MTNQMKGELTFCPVCFPIARLYAEDDSVFCFTGRNTTGLTVHEDGVEIADRVWRIMVSSGRPGLLLFLQMLKPESEKLAPFDFETCAVHAFEPLIHMRYAPNARLGPGGGPWVDAWRARMTALAELFSEYPNNGGFPVLGDQFLQDAS